MQEWKASSWYVSAATKVAVDKFSMFSLASNIRIPRHQINPTASFIEQAKIGLINEVNELDNVTMNEMRYFVYPTDINTN